uniref:EF-hand domain-containing protein n=1 Tax=Amphimedon queenslandica TaxID=400682 RepID=A0A1X7TFH2_AMPQE
MSTLTVPIKILLMVLVIPVQDTLASSRVTQLHQSQLPTGLTPQLARSFLYNFIEYISRNGDTSVITFRKYVEVARVTRNDPNIDKICDILDKFTLSGDHGEEKVEEALQDICKRL